MSVEPWWGRRPPCERAGLAGATLLAAVNVLALFRALGIFGRHLGGASVSLETATILAAAFVGPALLALAYALGRTGPVVAVASMLVSLPIGLVSGLALPNALSSASRNALVTGNYPWYVELLGQWYVLLLLVLGSLALLGGGLCGLWVALRSWVSRAG